MAALMCLFFMLLGLLIAYLYLQANTVSKASHQAELTKLQTANQALLPQKTLHEEASRQLLAKEQEIRTLVTRQESLITELSTAEASKDSALKQVDVLNTEIRQLKEDHKAQINAYHQLSIENEAHKANCKALTEKLATQKDEIQELRQRFLHEFKEISEKIYEEKTSSFSKSSRESLDAILNPLKENLGEFKKKVEETYTTEAKERHSLQAQVKQLMELNQRVSHEANNLTRALTGDNQAQGEWGEMILETILENSGLRRGYEYDVQSTFRDEHQNMLRPDVIIHYPGARKLVIDSKVSLTAYERFVNAENEADKQNALKMHLSSIRKHVASLSQKNYTDLPGAIGFIMMFIPIEPAYLAAINAAPDLWSEAYRKKIVLISPTNLIAAMKLIADLWERENRSRNIEEIVKTATGLYDKMFAFITNMKSVESSLNKALETHQKASKQLTEGKGNVIGRLEKMKSLGLSPKNDISNLLIVDTDEDK